MAAERKLPGFEVAGAAFVFLARERWTILRLSWFPMLLATLAERLARGQVGIAGSEFLTVATWAVIAVSLHRVILFGDRDPYTFLNVRFGKVQALFAILPAAYLLTFVTLSALGLPTEFHLKGGPAMAMWIVFAVIVFLIARFCLVFPIAVVERRIDFAQAWLLSHGNVWRLIGVTLLVIMLAQTAYGLLEQTIFAVQKVTPAAMSKEQFEDSWLRLLVLDYPFSIALGALCVGILSFAYKALAGFGAEAVIKVKE
jgi:hypothetical protein